MLRPIGCGLFMWTPGAGKPASPTLTNADAVAMFKSQGTGKYTVGERTPDGIKITTHVDAASGQAIIGNDRGYFVCVDGNTITFSRRG